jgi:hypothetical protein
MPGIGCPDLINYGRLVIRLVGCIRKTAGIITTFKGSVPLVPFFDGVMEVE